MNYGTAIIRCSSSKTLLKHLALMMFLFGSLHLVSQTAGSGAFTVQGTEKARRPTDCGSSPNKTQDVTPNYTCPLVYDTGTVTVYVSGFGVSVLYQQGSTATGIAQSLQGGFNAANSPVTATLSSATITLRSKVTGQASNYHVTSSSTTDNPALFGTPSFSVAPSDFYLTGGTDGIPRAPTGLSANAAANGLSVALAWTDNAVDEANYVVERCTGPGCSSFAVLNGTLPANTNAFTDLTVAPGTTYKYRVKAINGVGSSSYATTSDIPTPAVPATPVAAVSQVQNLQTASVVWGDVATETAYYLERCTGTSCSSGFTVIGNNLPQNTTSYTDSGLTPSTTYGYRVRALNAVGYSGYSTIVYLTVAATPPAAPSGLTTAPSQNGFVIALTWTDNATNESSYTVRRCAGSSCSPIDYVSGLSANSVSYTDSTTGPGTTYGYTVCAVGLGGTTCSAVAYGTTASAQATVHYYITDHLGSATVITDSVGNQEEEEMYFPYGGERWHSGVASNHYKFTGKERDSETGLDYFGARYYGSNIGRFQTPDPLMASAHASDPQTWNRYAYTLNNPLRYIDPDGMEVPDSCAKDQKCKIVVKLNVIYDKSAKWSDKDKQKLEAQYLEKAKKDYKTSNIELKTTFSEGTFTKDDSGFHFTGLQKDSLNVYFSNGTGVNAPGVSFSTPHGDVTIVDPGAMEALSTNLAWPLGTNTLEHELAHQFLGHTSEPQGSHEMETDWKVYKQGVWDRPVQDFRQGLEPKSYAAPVNPEANKPEQ